MEVFILAAWHIWKQTNGQIFEQINPYFADWKRKFKDEVALHMHGVKNDLKHVIFNWLTSF